MRKRKLVSIGIIAVAIIAVVIISALIFQHQQELSRTDYEIVVKMDQRLSDDSDLKAFMAKSSKGEPCNLRITTMYEDGNYVEEVSFDGTTFSGQAEGKDLWSGFPYVFDETDQINGVNWRVLVFSKKEKITFHDAMMSTGLSSDLEFYEEMHGIFL